MENLEHFNKLFAINCNDKTEKKNNGSTELTYLSWCYAWSEVKKLYPNARYEILKFGDNKLPYVFDEKTGYMVFTRVEIEDIEHEMWLPVMDSANKAMKDKPYTYKVKKYNSNTKQYEFIEKEVQPATMFDINKTIMRCLTKNLAMFGLGLYIYAGEDLPENVDNEEPKASAKTSAKTSAKSTEDYKQALLDKLKELNIDVNTYAKENKLSSKTTQEEAKGLLEKLVKGVVA